MIPEHAIDAQSLVALSDLVVSAGGTMNREAVALGVPVYTTFAGRSVQSTRCSSEKDACASSPPPTIELREAALREQRPTTRDPALLLDLMLSALDR